ncbi:hypothetical protein LCGC14_2837560 [marine sediment metagenome]|uniref:Uncharacterized protein n=1 Tax=marine sediment metagenome TaxID=412755 RepID=A0A0F9AKN0_9ZZZZ
MKKLALILVLTGLVLAQPTLDPEPIVDKVVKKLDDNTLEIKTTTTTVNIVLHDKAELQTRLAHIPERIATHEAQIAALNAEALEIQQMLDVLK